MKISWTFLFLAFIYSFNSFAEFCPEKYCRDFWFTKIATSESEREFEYNHEVEDDITDSRHSLILGINKHIAYDTFISFEMGLFHIGENDEFYKNEQKQLNDKKFNFESLREPTVEVSHWFDHRFGKSFSHGMFLTYTPKLYRPSVYDFGSGRHQIKVNYKYLHHLKTIYIEGNIATELFGRKKLILSDGNIEVTPAYTEVNTTLGAGYENQFLDILLYVGYGQTTNYSNKSAHLTRQSDKGFVTIIGFDFEFYKNRDYQIVINGLAKTKVFNAINEDLNKDVDYELEESNLSILLKRKF